MMLTPQIRLLDQEVIYEQLPAHIDRNHIGRMRQVGRIRRSQVAEGHALRRPDLRQENAVVQLLLPTCGYGSKQNRKSEPAHAELPYQMKSADATVRHVTTIA